jgi:hypothetical protein
MLFNCAGQKGIFLIDRVCIATASGVWEKLWKEPQQTE